MDITYKPNDNHPQPITLENPGKRRTLRDTYMNSLRRKGQDVLSVLGTYVIGREEKMKWRKGGEENKRDHECQAGGRTEKEKNKIDILIEGTIWD